MVQAGARKNEKPTWNTFYSDALLAAQAENTNDSLAQHRIAERAADRAMHLIKAAKASANHSQKLLVDQAFLEVFGNEAGGRGPFVAVEFFPDRILARGADGRLYDIGYVVGINGVTFDNPQLASSVRYIAAASADATTLEEIQAAEAEESLRTAIERAEQLARIEARANEAISDFSRRREESLQILSALAIYSQALVDLADFRASVGEDRQTAVCGYVIESAQYRGILAGCGPLPGLK
jgi:hypothetical protein